MNRFLAAIALAIAPFVAAPAKAQPAPAAPLVQLDHVSIVTMGQGDPVILIPGLSSPRAVYDGIAPELAKAHRVYLVQVNGFGGDDPRANLKPGVLDGIIADLVATIERDRLGKPAVIGHSMGGLVGMMLAARHPEKVGRLLVIDALPFISTLFDPSATPATIQPRAEQMRTMLAASYVPGKVVPTVTSDPGGIWSNTAAGRIQVANRSLKADARVVAQAMYEDMITDVKPELGKVTARPFVILYAAGVGEAPTKAVWEPAYAGTPATLVAVPDSYHFIMLDQPARFTKEVKAFLAK